MRAISVFSLDTGTSTRWCLAAAALRMRVRKSAIGSVCIIGLPARFRYSGNFVLQRHSTQTNSAHLELTDVRARTATNQAAIAHANLEFRFLPRLSDFCGSG